MVQDLLLFIIVETYILKTDLSLRILHLYRLLLILNIRCCLYHLKETLKSAHALLQHLCQFHKNLDGADEDSDIQSDHGHILRCHLTSGDQNSSHHQSQHIHHSLEEGIASLEKSHSPVVILLGYKEGLISSLKLPALDLLIGKSLNDPNPRQRILEGGIHMTDLPSIIQKSGMHGTILFKGYKSHNHHCRQKHQGQLPLDQKQKNKGTDDLHQGNKQILRSMVGHLGYIKKIGDQLTHHGTGVIAVIVGKGQLS